MNEKLLERQFENVDLIAIWLVHKFEFLIFSIAFWI